MLFSKVYKRVKFRSQYRIFTNLIKQIDFSPEEKQAYQLDKLKHLLTQAKKIKYYRALLRNIDIENLDYSEFSKIELLDKGKIRMHLSSLINEDYPYKHKTYVNTSGGSTGAPVKFYQTLHQANCGRANYHLANFINGIGYDDRMLVFWGAVRDMHSKGDLSIPSRIKSVLENSRTLNTFVLNKDKIEKYISILNEYKPTAIKAYVHSLYDISKYINEHNITINSKPIVHTTTGPLYTEVREEIKRAFNDAHVFSFYGSREVSAIATEIKDKEGMMVLYDNVLVEIVDKDGRPVDKGEEGEIVITTLNNMYMPLIRYRIGDRAVKADGKEVFGTLWLQSVLGRTLGVIHKRDGSYIDGQFFTSLFFNVRGIENFQLVQKSLDILVLNIVRNINEKEIDLSPILERIKMELENPHIEINYVDTIDLTSTGKIMYVYSEL